MHVRRVVTANGSAGAGRVVSDGDSPRQHDFRTLPGLAQTLIWSSERDQPAGPEDPTAGVTSFVPQTGSTRFIMLQIPPDEQLPADVDPAAVAEDQQRGSPGLAELFEPDGSGMHASPTVDYVVVVRGELTLDLGPGGEHVLRQGDVAVQCGTRHAWRNRTAEPALAAFVLVGADVVAPPDSP